MYPMKRINLLPALFWFVLAGLTFPLCSCAAGDSANESADAATDAEGQTEKNQEEEEAQVVLNAAGGYGQVINADAAISCEELTRVANATEDVNAKVVGTVTAACQMSGCWMKLECGGEPMRVTFRDYGFFVPKDLAGSKVVIQGTARKKEVPVETLRHFAQDEGKSEAEIAAITEPGWELEFVADGVLPVQ